MGARPLRRAIQRYIEDPLADEVLAQNLEPGSTVEVDKAPESDDKDADEVTITVTKPVRKREAVGVGAEGGSSEPAEFEEGEAGRDDDSQLPDEPPVLPDVPDAPPEPGGDEN
jgi:ATP-dependent Clp protease ATP-binding subunit ClpC